MPTENQIDCPALHKRSSGYPYGDRVPRTVRMLVTVTAERFQGVEIASTPEAKAGQTYPAWTNSHGAVVAVMGDGARLGLRPAEFEVDTWHRLATEPAPQHPEPIAWMVGTAFWWTKEEAERDAAAMGLPIVGLGPLTNRTAVELAECEAMADMVTDREWAEHVGTGDISSKVEAAFTQLHNDLHEADEKLAERDALLAEIEKRHWSGVDFDLPADLAAQIKALSASAEPIAPAAQPGKCLDGGDCGIGGTCKWCPHTSASPAQQPS